MRSRKNREQKPMILAWLLALFGVLGLVATVYVGATIVKERSWPKAAAVATEWRQDTYQEKDKYNYKSTFHVLCPVLEFKAKGKSYSRYAGARSSACEDTNSQGTENHDKAKIGRAYQIRYRPDDPTDYAFEGSVAWAWIAVMGFISLMFFILSWLLRACREISAQLTCGIMPASGLIDTPD